MGPRRLVQGNWIGQEQLRQARFSGLVSFPLSCDPARALRPFLFFFSTPPFFSPFSLSKRSRLTCPIAWIKPGAASNPAFRETPGRIGRRGGLERPGTPRGEGERAGNRGFWRGLGLRAARAKDDRQEPGRPARGASRRSRSPCGDRRAPLNSIRPPPGGFFFCPSFRSFHGRLGHKKRRGIAVFEPLRLSLPKPMRPCAKISGVGAAAWASLPVPAGNDRSMAARGRRPRARA